MALYQWQVSLHLLLLAVFRQLAVFVYWASLALLDFILPLFGLFLWVSLLYLIIFGLSCLLIICYKLKFSYYFQSWRIQVSKQGTFQIIQPKAIYQNVPNWDTEEVCSMKCMTHFRCVSIYRYHPKQLSKQILILKKNFELPVLTAYGWIVSYCMYGENFLSSASS